MKLLAVEFWFCYRTASSPKSLGKHDNDSLVQQFRKLQREAFDKVQRQVMNNLVKVPSDRQLAFICSIVVVSEPL